MWRLLGGAAWQAVSGVSTPVKRVSFGSSGLCLTAHNDEIFHLPAKMALTFGAPTPVPGLLTDVSVGGSLVVGVNAGNDIFKWVNGSWVQIAGKLAHISCGEDNTVVGCNANGELFMLGDDGATWQALPGALVDVSVGSKAHIVGVNKEHQVWSLNVANGNAWTQLACPHQLIDVSVGSDGTVYGVTAQQQVVHYTGQDWTVLPGALVSISCADKHNVIGVNADGAVWRLTPPTTWTAVPGCPGSVARVSVGSGGLWVTGKDHSIQALKSV